MSLNFKSGQGWGSKYSLKSLIMLQENLFLVTLQLLYFSSNVFVQLFFVLYHNSFKCSTCPLVFGCWKLSHMIFLKLRKKELENLQNTNSSTGKSLSEALLFAEHGENMLCTKIVLNVRGNFC